MRQRLEQPHAARGHLLAHARHRGRSRAELRAPMHQVEARGAAEELERPVECRVAATEDHQMLAGELGGVLDPVLDGTALEGLRALDADAARLERAEARGDYYRAGIEAHAGGGGELEASVLRACKLADLVPEVQLRLEGFDLLEQPVDQLLRAAHRQRRD